MADIKVFSDAAEVANWTASTLVASLTEALAAFGSATWAAAGGSTPAAVYDLLAREHAQALEWTSVSVIMGDERCVPPDDSASNWGELDRRFLQYLGTKGPVKFRPAGERGAERAAEEYQAALGQLPLVASGTPRLDVVWLGVGEDGHTLSLFPGNPATSRTGQLVVPVHDSPKPPPDRISLTFDALAGAQRCVILATGEGKRGIIRAALEEGSTLPITNAARAVAAAGGDVVWALDRDAAGGLPG